ARICGTCSASWGTRRSRPRRCTRTWTWPTSAVCRSAATPASGDAPGAELDSRAPMSLLSLNRLFFVLALLATLAVSMAPASPAFPQASFRRLSLTEKLDKLVYNGLNQLTQVDHPTGGASRTKY